MDSSFLSHRATDAAKSFTDLAALNDVKKLGRNQDPEAIMEVARQFESFFITQLMKEMRAGVDLIGKDNFTNSSEMRFHQQMFDQQLSMEVANQGGYGLAELLARQLTEQFDLDWGDSEPVNPTEGLQRQSTQPPRLLAAPAPVESQDISAESAEPLLKDSDSLLSYVKEKIAPVKEWLVPENTDREPQPDISKENFFSVLKEFASDAARKLGVDKRVLLAQAALETGWGQFISKGAEGASSNNLFNIKSSSAWQGDSVNVVTLEYQDGVAQKERASFRSYQSYEDSFNDYVNFITSNPRYKNALAQASDSEAYLTELQRAGYATDPEYANKILQLLRQPEFADEGQP